MCHGNVLAAWRAIRASGETSPRADRGTEAASSPYLPLAHIADRFTTHYAAMLFGHTVTCCPDPRQMGRLLPEVRPTQFMSVPRIWQMLKTAAEGALPVGPEQADEATRAAVRARLDLDKCEVAVCAAAPVPREVLEFFHALGVPICEVYGLSETCAVATANPPGHIKIGTVGPPVPGVELRLAADGEVLLRGEVVMRGYRTGPTRRWRRSTPTLAAHRRRGDARRGRLLRIVDRKKELIIGAAGENMSPATIEATLKGASPLIGQACVIGDARPYNVALLTLDPEVAAAIAARHGEDAVAREVAAAVQRANARLSRAERSSATGCSSTTGNPVAPELTPTLKRSGAARIAERYAADIESLYMGARSVEEGAR